MEVESFNKLLLEQFFGTGSVLFEGNPNFQGMLNWILQILHYYCRREHKYWKLTDYWTKCCSLFAFSLFTATCASCRLPQRQSTFNFKHPKWSFVLYKVSFSGLKMILSKLSQLDITAYRKNCVYNYLNLRCISCLQL